MITKLNLIRKIIFCLSITLTLGNAYSQDTIVTYYDKDWESLKDSSGAHYYSSFFQINDSLWKVEDYYIDGQIQMIGYYEDSNKVKKTGSFKYYYKSGKIKTERKHVNGMIIKEIGYFESGQIKEEINFTNGQFDGELRTYWENGTLHRNEFYNNGKVVSGKMWSSTGEQVDFFPYFVLPEYKGGEKRLMKFISRNVQYPKECYRKGMTGRVIVEFVIAKDGSIINAKIIQSVNKQLDKEALRVINSMPKWEPGKVESIPVNVSFRIPINFKIQ